MNKLTLLLTFGFFAVFSLQSTAQDFEFHHGAGAQYDMVTATDGSGFIGAPALSYHPRLVMELDRDMSLSLGAPLSLGFSFGTSGNYLIYGAPATIDFNFGFASLERSRSDFGGFVGAGYGIYGLGGVGIYPSIYAHVGGRFIFQDSPISASVFTYQPMEDIQVYGVRVIYELTDF